MDRRRFRYPRSSDQMPWVSAVGRAGWRMPGRCGFVRRLDMKRTFGQLRFSPRPRRIPSIRQITMTGSVEYISNVDGQLETRHQNAYFNI